MAEIVLIQPNAGSWEISYVRPPLSLLAIAALPYAKGHSIKILDQRLTKDLIAELNKVIASETVLVGLSVITGPQIRYALDISKYIKERFKKTIVWGGNHPTLMPEQTAANEYIDYVVAGDGEDVFYDLFLSLKKGLVPAGLRGVYSKNKVSGMEKNIGAGVDPSRQNKKYAALISDWDKLPPQPYSLIDLSKYAVLAIDNKKSTVLNTSRGCPGRCKFCSNPVLNQGKWRGFTSAKVLAQVEYLYRKHDIRNIFFQDDYFPGAKKRFIEILEGLKKYNKKLKWSTIGVRADFIAGLKADEVRLLVDSGCVGLDIGIETGTERLLEYINKGESLAQIKEANKILSGSGIKVKYSFVIGLPTETYAEIKQSVRLAVELEKENKDACSVFFVYTPIPGTYFFEESVARGFKIPESLLEWSKIDWDTWATRYSDYFSKRMAKKLEAISFSSYFASANIGYKYTSRLLKTVLKLYAVIARFRFEHMFYFFYIEKWLKDILLNIVEYRRRAGFFKLKGRS